MSQNIPLTLVKRRDLSRFPTFLRRAGMSETGSRRVVGNRLGVGEEVAEAIEVEGVEGRWPPR